jgi:hypothetical protein
MYPKEITGWINEAWAKGFSAEQTVEVIQKKRGLKIGLATVYRHRHNATTKDLVDELMRQQQFDIATSDNEELKLKYRNELLKIFIPAMTINFNKNVNENKTELTLNATSDLLKQYESLFEEAALLENCAPQQIRPAQTNP